MAEKPQQQPIAASSPKKIAVTVVSNYGGHLPGAAIEVDEREYLRLREPVRDEEGLILKSKGWRFPVLISKADQEKQEEQRRKDEADRRLAADERGDAENGPGWAELERQSLERLQSSHRSEQARQVADVLAAGIERA